MIAAPKPIALSEREDILQNNFKYTLFSWSKQTGQHPIAVSHAGGVYLYDYDGKRYLDFSSGLMNVNIGHGDPRITEAVVKQMQQVSYVTPSCVTKVRGELGKKLAQICPADLNKAFFTLCGASSIENAIKLARLYTFVRWNYIFIAPPLCITEAQLKEGLAIIANALKIADAHCRN